MATREADASATDLTTAQPHRDAPVTALAHVAEALTAVISEFAIDNAVLPAGELTPACVLGHVLADPTLASALQERDAMPNVLLNGVRQLLAGAFRQGDALLPFPRPSTGASDRERAAHDLLVRYVSETTQATAGRVWQVGRPVDYAAGRAIMDAAPAIQIAVIQVALARIQRLARQPHHAQGAVIETWRLKPLISQLCRRNQPYTTEDVVHLLTVLTAPEPTRWHHAVPLVTIVRSVERVIARQGLSDAIRVALEGVHRQVTDEPSLTADQRKVRAIVDHLLGQAPAEEPPIDDADDWGYAAAEALARLDGPDREPWLALLAHAQASAPPRPSAAWLTRARKRIEVLGEARCKALAIEWLGLLGGPSRGTTFRNPSGYSSAMPSAIIAGRNAQLLKGLIWCCSLFDGADLARAVAEATIACFKKVPGYGARSVKAGNAGVWTLGAMPGARGVSQLQRIKQRVKGAAVQAQIDAALHTAADQAGLTRVDLDELSVPTFGLTEGRLRQTLGDITAELCVDGTHAVTLCWLRSDGPPRLSEPAAVNRDYPGELKALKATLKDIQATLPAQRDRIERLLLTERSWSLADWRARYLDHPLLAVLARCLVWSFQGDDRAALGAWRDGTIVDINDQPLDWLTDATHVRLWHPIGSDPEVVVGWRHWLERHAVTQPFKQAHREVYILTDAELATNTYSNRFAAHILRQHQLVALARSRGWHATHQGAWDGGNGAPTLTLPEWRLRAEYWVDGIVDGGPELLSNAGVCLYVRTDQVRFLNGDNRPLPLTEVPALVFSEVMRDVDLFVGVASVGNDPAWRDGGPERYHTYWHDYSFGELSASAQTRRAALERLVPRLKIADRCSVTDRFLVVRGDLRIYKIHLGSGNILMEPNSQYLCIVTDRRGSTQEQGTTFLPFEGDAGLALILSKAFLLADDRTITDPTITRQIRPR